MNIEKILAFAGTVLSLSAALLAFIIKFVKNEKAKKALNTTIRITQALQPLIVRAEEFAGFSGAEKKQFVMTAANRFALDNRLKFDEEKVSALVDELVDTTKRVNARPKDKLSAAAKSSGGERPVAVL